MTDPTLTRDDGLDSLIDPVSTRLLLPALTIVWSRSEPARLGETCLIRSNALSELGRGADTTANRLRFVRQRPGGEEDTGELRSERISHRQLTVQRQGMELAVQSVGRRGLKVNGHSQDSARVRPGDLLEIDRELLLLVESRPDSLAEGPMHRFGEPDADGMVGESPAAWALRRQIAFAAGGGHVLVRGASGTGKELVCQALHRASGRSGPCVSRNAATFPETLLDAELFGNRVDYPNPGMPERAGAIGEADGGTLFLDEIGEVSHAAQAHLLRVLDGGEYQRLGDATPRHADLRVVGATNRPLGSLKHDFLARFPHRIAVCGLQERRADIPLLVGHLLLGMARERPELFPSGPPHLHPRFATALLMHVYETHTRELSQLLWDAVAAWHQAGGGKYLDHAMEVTAPPRRSEARNPASIGRQDILDAYRRFGGVQARVPEFLGLRDRFQLGRLEKKLGISAEDKRAAVDT